MNKSQIITYLPYQKPFLFVDGIDSVSENEITGHYTFKTNEFFYQGHFKNNPVTPGVILTECMAQIGLVCFGIYLLKEELNNFSSPKIALTSHQMDFYLPVLPNEKVTVISEKDVFRFNKLKCKVRMMNEKGELICRGFISGMAQILAKAEIS
ncbi:3-hydroxyacyl-ACP dehydratase FabZ family protein [Winogradskyella bathintestinalis]|uniref:Hydroxymyristoyl-ACP dehydratase n=1 Tax=Winogradskyella bathintestinalis TaxID=3035208 RepID=A0ABT7ZRA9_9FLAO|nr:hydroxymyristoyl-ACP dehydratase [Winogradskyella bathintestinalis]MDN3491488.1 hydroxymyristoyl-ACP dehydratase [Winogradskyella bathintestinalis]